VKEMSKAYLHKVLMYINEALAISLLIAWLWLQRIELLLFFLAFLVISATFHETYLLSSIYEEINKKEEKREDHAWKEGK
jgi:hypothetical protein